MERALFSAISGCLKWLRLKSGPQVPNCFTFSQLYLQLAVVKSGQSSKNSGIFWGIIVGGNKSSFYAIYPRWTLPGFLLSDVMAFTYEEWKLVLAACSKFFAFLRWFWNNNNNFSTTFKLLGYCQPWRKHSLLSKIEIDGWQSWCAEIRIWPQNWRSLRSNNKVLVFIMHRKPHFFGLVCHRRFFPSWHFRLFLIWILKYLIFRPHEMFNVFVCRTACQLLKHLKYLYLGKYRLKAFSFCRLQN